MRARVLIALFLFGVVLFFFFLPHSNLGRDAVARFCTLSVCVRCKQ